jgi:hypothetical protein
MTSLLEQHDDANHWERPSNFDWPKESADFSSFLRELESKVGRNFEYETGSRIQDASFHSQIVLPGGLLRFSNFGRMIAFTPDNEVPAEIRLVIGQLANARGYTLVPTTDLEQPYPRGGGTRLTIGTWWIRYFDYL